MPRSSHNGAGQPAVDCASLANGIGSPISDSAYADSHGRAALLLVESLIHELVAKAVLTLGEAIDIIDIAIDVEGELALAAGPASLRRDESPLTPLAATFRSASGV